MTGCPATRAQGGKDVATPGNPYHVHSVGYSTLEELKTIPAESRLSVLSTHKSTIEDLERAVYRVNY